MVGGGNFGYWEESMTENVSSQKSEFVAHAKNAGKAFVLTWKSLLPDNFWKYGAETGREALMAVGALMDAAADRLDKVEQAVEEATPKARGGRKAKVEVE
jgi:hypothetical protein